MSNAQIFNKLFEKHANKFSPLFFKDLAKECPDLLVSSLLQLEMTKCERIHGLDALTEVNWSDSVLHCLEHYSKHSSPSLDSISNPLFRECIVDILGIFVFKEINEQACKLLEKMFKVEDKKWLKCMIADWLYYAETPNCEKCNSPMHYEIAVNDPNLIGPCHDNGNERLLKEISKCELVCANCHRIRTYKRLKEKDLDIYQL